MLKFYMVKTTLKLLLAFALCYWLFTNGKLDFSLVSKTFHLGYLWVLAIVFFLLHLLLNALRFKSLLQDKSGSSISTLKVVSFDAVGAFFSVILPGAVGGDLIRFFYYKNISPKLTPPVVGSLIIVDRFMGLLGIMLIGMIVSLIQFETLKILNPQLVSLVWMNCFLTVGVSLFIVIIFSNLVSHDFLLQRMTPHFARWPKLHDTFLEMISLKLHLSSLMKNLLISVASQLFTIASFWALISPFMPHEASVLNLFTIIPIGLLGASVPIAPAGLGVGHLFFESLFQMLHIDHGASLFNLYFVMNVMICLLGVFPYIMMRGKMEN